MNLVWIESRFSSFMDSDSIWTKTRFRSCLDGVWILEWIQIQVI